MLISNQDGVLSLLSSESNQDFTHSDHESDQNFYRDDLEPSEFLH